MSGKSSSYRPDIDGLRAVAILGVLIYHLDGRLLPGGFVGVDVFFVISGFLISSIIDRELGEGNFSIVGFYERRIRRIFPALFVVMGAVLVVCYLKFLPQDLAAVGKSVRYVITAMPNLLFLREHEDYFNESTSRIPLLHTWSLGVEEQFYLFFPLVLGVAYRFLKTPRARLVPLLVLFVASLAASALVVPVQPMKAFFLLPHRAWELLLGALLALGSIPAPRGAVGRVLGIVGMGMIAGSMFFFNGGTPFPGLSALIPCSGAGLLLWSGRDRTAWTSRLLALKPVVFLGLISYSVYLWHWPLIVFAKDAGGLLLAMSSLLAGYLSWRWIEHPFRSPSRFSRVRVFSLWAAGSVLLAGAGMVAERSGGFPGRFPPEVLRILSFKEKPPHWKRSMGDVRGTDHAPVFGTPGVAPRFALWGDSHGAAIVPGLEAAAREAGQSFKEFGFGALPPVAGVVDISDKDPTGRLAYSQAVLDLLAGDPAIQTVILHARWSLYCGGQNESGTSRAGFHGLAGNSRREMENFYASRIRETVGKLLDSGKKVVLIYPVPELGINAPDRLALQAANGQALDATVPCEDFFDRQAFIIGVLDSLGTGGRIMRIKPHERFLHQGRATIFSEGQVLYMDDDHLSPAGALYLKPLFTGIFAGPSPR